eukprot:TRINITY_DN113346_c0_g1_i1.p1 TRINITY_DN113346_c0_g1~~TRINITY_DN113346_c0_g1_i1.p1  ORF type:complete len:361 (+),score=75.08 TRINITY_DN113346_c0_g1_i1:58-1140(+)
MVVFSQPVRLPAPQPPQPPSSPRWLRQGQDPAAFFIPVPAGGLLDSSGRRTASPGRRLSSADFLFCNDGIQVECRQVVPSRFPAARIETHVDDDLEEHRGDSGDGPEADVQSFSPLTFDKFGLPPPEPAHLLLLAPAVAAALQPGGIALAPAGLAASCLPIVAPFSMPPMTPGAWCSNKQALAYGRCVVVALYFQAGFAVLKIMHGNLVGGFMDGIQAAMGFYSLTPGGLGLFPTYMMMAGVNGVMNLLQVLQMFQGVPLQYIPQVHIWPPVTSLVSAYFGWQFCKEIRNIANGYPQDSDGCFVRIMAGDWWPDCLTAGMFNGGGHAEEPSSSGGVFSSHSRQPQTRIFEGSGRRLGSDS